MEIALLMGLTLTFNIIILFIKANKGRYVDMVFDISLLLAVGYVTAGSQAGLTAGMLASTIISLFLLFRTPKVVKALQDELEDENEERTIINYNSNIVGGKYIYSF